MMTRPISLTILWRTSSTKEASFGVANDIAVPLFQPRAVLNKPFMFSSPSTQNYSAASVQKMNNLIPYITNPRNKRYLVAGKTILPCLESGANVAV